MCSTGSRREVPSPRVRSGTEFSRCVTDHRGSVVTVVLVVVETAGRVTVVVVRFAGTTFFTVVVLREE